MIDCVTLYNASSARRTYWRLNREAGASLLDQLLVTTWQDMAIDDEQFGGGADTWPSDLNADGMDDVEAYGSWEDMLLNDDDWTMIPGPVQFDADTRGDDCEINQWSLVVQACVAVKAHRKTIPTRRDERGRILKKVTLTAMLDERFGMDRSVWTPDFTVPQGYQLVDVGSRWEHMVKV